jgi:hypothetical protein
MSQLPSSEAGQTPIGRMQNGQSHEQEYDQSHHCLEPMNIGRMSPRFTNPSWCCKYGCHASMDARWIGAANTFGSVFCEKHHELQTPVFIGSHFPLNGDFESVFGRFWSIPRLLKSSFSGFIHFSTK